jgi:phage terminase small subunit
MAPLANAKHEAFARGIVEGKTGRKAYLAAGYAASVSTADQMASKLTRNPKVAARIAELKAKVAQASIMTAQETLERISALARNAEKEADQLRAQELMGKHHRLFIEREDRNDYNVQVHADLSRLNTEQLIALKQLALIASAGSTALPASPNKPDRPGDTRKGGRGGAGKDIT